LGILAEMKIIKKECYSEFKKIDKNNDGFLDRKELCALSNSCIERIIRSGKKLQEDTQNLVDMDTNKEDMISYE